MAANTELSLRQQVIYSIFVRNYSESGTFRAVEEDLPRIKALGTDIIWLMPIQPVGEKNRKGSLGSPYAISDYRTINPEFGTLDDFKSLCHAIHREGMKVIIDVVYHHTSPDSLLSKVYPEYFYHKPDGSFGNQVGDWWDVIDLDFSNHDLWNYLIETLRYWAGFVDGFRCDVASGEPKAFWEEARAAVAEVRPDALWLAESVDPDFIVFLRSRDLTALSDSELYDAFDITYDYDIYTTFKSVLTGAAPLADYANALNRQEFTYPGNYMKARCLENHDRPRAHALIPNEQALRNWTAMLYLLKGPVMLYNGQEQAMTHTPTLFDKDTLQWEKTPAIDLSSLMSKCKELRQDPLFIDFTFHAEAKGDVMVITDTENSIDHQHKILGIFPAKGQPASVQVDLANGSYTNLLTNERVDIYENVVTTSGEAIIISNR